MAALPALLDHGKLPAIDTARLPALYQAAKIAVAECARVDECKEWADRMEALASYARQQDDPELLNHTMRIRARAIDRCGELLKEIEPSKGGRPPETGMDDHTSLGRFGVAKEAGLSRNQTVTALRVNNVPREQFEALVESDNPPSVSKLAEIGTQHRAPLVDLGGRDPADFQAATGFISLPKEFLDEARGFKLKAAWRGMDAKERAEARANYFKVVAWITQAWETLDGL